jgi:hypothetical protein
MTPKMLDYVVNGAKVFIYKRPDGSKYATVHDFSKFGLKEMILIRVPLKADSTVESVLSDATVLAALI